MSRSSHPPEATLHTNIALMECDSPVTLEETLLLLADLPLHIKRVGSSSLAFPASELPLVRKALEKEGCFPRVVGGPEGGPL